MKDFDVSGYVQTVDGYCKDKTDDLPSIRSTENETYLKFLSESRGYEKPIIDEVDLYMVNEFGEYWLGLEKSEPKKVIPEKTSRLNKIKIWLAYVLTGREKPKKYELILSDFQRYKLELENDENLYGINNGIMSLGGSLFPRKPIQKKELTETQKKIIKISVGVLAPIALNMFLNRRRR